MSHSSKIYIAIEGIDGTGKTHVADYIAKKFYFSKIQEPSDTLLGKLIISNYWDPLTDFFLFMADRSSFLGTLDLNKNYVSDRSLYSSFAYQGVYLLNKFKSFEDYYNFFMQNASLLPRIPDYILILYSDVNIALNRIKLRGDISRFEKGDFLEKVQNIYFKLKEKMKNSVLIDSNGSLDKVYKNVDKIVTELLSQDRPL